MIHTIKSIKWVIATSLIAISLGVLTFFTFIGKSFIKLNDFNFQILLILDLITVLVFIILIFYETYKIFKNKKAGKLGSYTTLRYLVFFSSTTFLPSVFIAIFSLVLFNLSIQQFFDKKVRSIVHNSREVALSYVEQTRDTIEADILLMTIDLNQRANLFYQNPGKFVNILSNQRMLRKLDEAYLLDGAGNIIMSNVIDLTLDFIEPPPEAFANVLNKKPVRITDPDENRTSALIKLDNFLDTYLYIVKFMDPKLVNYLKETNSTLGFYYTVRNQKTGIKITFAVIYVLIVSLLLFLSVIISINFASRLTKPIINLIGASEKISMGDLNIKVPLIKTDRGFKKLNENFNLMIDRLKMQQDKLILIERHEAWENVAKKLAHEIKNPLTPIQLSIDRIREKYLKKDSNDNKEFSNYLNIMGKQIKEIEHLVNEFSNFARMPKPVFKKINVYDLLDKTLALHINFDPSINFSINKLSKINFIEADEGQLSRVFINLIKNSIESIGVKKLINVDFKGKIDIEIKENSDYIYIIVADTGAGFNQVDPKKMLTPYFTTKKNGSGLGLAIVSKIISDHNGLIDFLTVNDGAKVKITIPKTQ
jgi:two-component system nitrogen regulation sensor histidine kinase NtrY